MADIYTGHLFHTRLKPVRHSFIYPCMMLCLDLDEIEQIANKSRVFSHNHLQLCSLYDTDYLTSAAGSLKEKLSDHLLSAGLNLADFSSIKMLTTPRILGLGFNPLTLYCCLDVNKNIHSVVAEVHNTYGEARIYVLSDKERIGSASHPRFRFSKTLFVSPFNGVEGHYDLQLNHFNQQQIKLRLDLWVKDKPLLQTGFSLQGTTLTDARLIATILRYPLTAIMAMPRIIYQALILRYIKKLQPRMKPKMRDENIKNGPERNNNAKR